MQPSARVIIVLLLSAIALLALPFLPGEAQAVGVAASLAAAIGLGFRARGYSTAWRCGAAAFALSAAWQSMLIGASAAGLSGLHHALLHYGTGAAYLLGLLWCVWLVDQASRQYDARRRAAGEINSLDLACAAGGAAGDGAKRSSNPLDLTAWFYGRRAPKLNQSMWLLGCYSLIFVLVCMAISYVYRLGDVYELPAGGGGGGMNSGSPQMAMAQTVRLQKVVKKKFVLNPYSGILFAPPPIDDVKLQLQTDHLYTVGSAQGGAGSGSGKGFGYGDGEGSGFGNGTGAGKVRFIRLEYAGGDWDQDFGVGADLNMLIEYGVRTGQKVSDRTESRTVAQLLAFPVDKSPPLVYLTGQKNIILTKSEIKSLRSYLLDRHGMLFGDNGGSRHFHSQFFTMMRQVLPECEPVKVPLDDQIHRVPFALPFLPYVAPHGGRDAWGWKVDGRWVCYYHPGDIGDAWSDGHSGVSREIWDACYRLGVNVIFYAHVEYSKWLMSRQKR